MNLFDKCFSENALLSRRMEILLSEDDVNEVREIAQKRNQKQSRFGAMTYGSKRQSLEAHLIGLVAEKAIAKFLNIGLDKQIYDNHGDDGTDLNIPGIGMIGIKCTTYLDNPFLRVEKEHFNDSIKAYVLCCVEPDTLSKVIVIGWATKDEVKNGKIKKFLKNGPINYVLTEPELRQFK